MPPSAFGGACIAGLTWCVRLLLRVVESAVQDPAAVSHASVAVLRKYPGLTPDVGNYSTYRGMRLHCVAAGYEDMATVEVARLVLVIPCCERQPVACACVFLPRCSLYPFTSWMDIMWVCARVLAAMTVCGLGFGAIGVVALAGVLSRSCCVWLVIGHRIRREVSATDDSVCLAV